MELQQQMPDRKLGGFLKFRQPGDYGRYVADNDPRGVASGFSNLEDFLAATPDYKNPVFDNLLKNDGTRAPITEEQLGSGQTLTGQPLVQQVQASLMNRMKKSPEYLAWADTVMQTGGYPTEENPGAMGVNTVKSLPIQGIGSLNQLNVTPPEIPISMQTPMSGFEGINNFSEFGKAPSFGVNSFGNTMGENNSFKNAFTDLQLNQQPFNDNQGLSSYVDNLVNGRLKNIFGGIMSAFK